MSRKCILLIVSCLSALSGTEPPRTAQPADPLERQFTSVVRPFVEKYCISCHGPKKQKAELDLSRDVPAAAVASNLRRWEQVHDRLQAAEMPPHEARLQPTAEERAAAVAWIRSFRDREAQRRAGDPGPVLARRLNNAEFNYTIQDLTGVDIRPARDFPVDPANEAGFDNSGESLTMSPALLKKYLAAVRLVADHLVLKPEGFDFAPHPVGTDTDRDRYCVRRIVDFYERHTVDYADYFLAAWKFRQHNQQVALAQLAREAGLSSRYLTTIWSALTDSESAVGPLAVLRAAWNELPNEEPAARRGCERLRDLVLQMRRLLKPSVNRLYAPGISEGSQPLVLWHNRELACRHRGYAGDVFADLRKLAEQLPEAKPLRPDNRRADTERDCRAAVERFCAVFPWTFVVVDRGPYYSPNEAGKGRPLTAGFHLMQGYFRDDGPLYELILDAPQRRELDTLWDELNFITQAPQRQYRDFIFFERAEPPRAMHDAEFDFARSEDKDADSPARMERLREVYLVRARRLKASDEVLGAIETYFATMSAEIRRVEQTRAAAEPSHLAALLRFAERAYRRPLSEAERTDLLAFYRKLRRDDELGHEDAVRDTVASILLSPHFCYRFDLAAPGNAVQPLTDYELASRLSYFLWASMPDRELLAHAAAGDLRRPDVLQAQARRMLRDPRIRRWAIEFGGNWLDFRRFEEHNSVDRERFPSFTNELRQAMFEEPVRYLTDVAQRNRSVLDLLQGADTFVNGPLARHYGMPAPPANTWAHVEDARPYGRGGLLPMAVFLTKNAPGLRTSPVKRGYWVVRRVLGEQIPPPPPTVPELPKDEAQLGALTLPQVLARHRDHPSCAGCHRRFDSVGLAFEGFGPLGERRTHDLAGHPVLMAADFPDGKERSGLDGLRDYLRTRRQGDFVDNLSRKLLAYALGRSLLPSDDEALRAMRTKLLADQYRFDSLVESIVATPQFLHKRVRDDAVPR